MFGQAEIAVSVQRVVLCCFVRMDVESIQPPNAFQAEYEGSIPFTRSNVFVSSPFFHSDKRAAAHSDKCPCFVRVARRFLVPVAICFVVRLTYLGSTLTVVCLLCARISWSVSSASPVSVRPHVGTM